MSSFLDKFNKDNYEEFLEEENKNEESEGTEPKENEDEPEKNIDELILDVEEQEEDSFEPDTKEIIIEEERNDDLSSEEDEEIIILEETPSKDEEETSIKEKPVKKEVFVKEVGPTRGNQEEVEIDTTFKKKKKKQRIILICVAVAILVSFGLTWFFINRVKVPDFVGKTYAEATKWSQQNKITLDVSNTFSKEFDENVVIEQDKEANKAVMKGSTLQITISNGADPEEVIKLPDFAKKKQSDVEAWIKENKMKNVSVIQEYSTDIPKGEVIKVTIKDTKVTSDTFKRKDYATVAVSRGEEVFEKDIEVPKFKDKSKAEVEEWAKKNEVEVEFTQQASNTVADGMVISQSVQGGEKVAKHDTIGFIVSSGKAVVIPNYYNYTAENAGSAGGISAEITSVYSDSVPYGYLIYQSHPAGAVYTLEDDVKVKVVYSLGMPYIPNLIGTQESDLPTKFFAFQSSGASITYDIVYTSSSCTKGIVVDASKYSQYTGLKDHVVVYVSDGAGSSCATEEAGPSGETESFNK